MRTFFFIAAAAALAACGPDGSGAETPASFIALQRDFEGYAQWEPFALSATVATDDPHTGSSRTVHLKARPPKGSTAFPVGTMIVKHVDGGQTFAMAKRGGEFNSAGAKGWEWFELTAGSTGTPVIVWRGVGPPAGEGYGGPAGTSCNSCHASAAENDFVRAPALALGDL